MSEFVQIIRFSTDDIDAVEKLYQDYEKETEGRSTLTSSVHGRDLDTGEYVAIVTFPSREDAEKNDALPETAASAQKMQALATGAPSFSNIEVLTFS